MYLARLAGPADFEGWREVARTALALRIPPENLTFVVGDEAPGLFAEPLPQPPADAPRSTVPRAFPDLAQKLIHHADPDRFSLAYRLLWRLQSERKLLEDAADPDVRRAREMETAPDVSRLRHERQMERSGMARASEQPAYGYNKRPDDLEEAREQAKHCKACDLWEPATQTVFGRGPADAPVIFVGEQPGDQEDLAGEPFVGPAGKVFDQALAAAGIDRSQAYVTNAVKHFKFVPRGRRRIHQKPDSGEVRACRWWLDLEREFVKPKLIVALGATAAGAIFEKQVTIRATRSRFHDLKDGTKAFVTVHPSYLLRLPDEESKKRETAAFEADMAKILEYVPELALAG